MTYFYNAKLITLQGIKRGSLLEASGKILAVFFNDDKPPLSSLDKCAKIDLQGMYLSAGFIETHVHGGGGADFNDATKDAFITAATTHLQHGATVICPTLAAADFAETSCAIDAFRQAQDVMGTSILHGLHLEGPYLNINQKGAIDSQYIRAPKPEEYMSLLKKANGAIKRWTFAPELEGSTEFLKCLLNNDVLPSIGHSDAEYSTVLQAFKNGCKLITHLYSATSTIVRRNGFRFPGIIESAYCIEGMVSEIIADGCHLPTEMLRMIWRMLGPDNVVLTTDAMRCAGTNVKEANLGSSDKGQKIIIEDDVAKLPDRSAFAGSIATPDRLIRVMHHSARVPLDDCIKMYTLTPARLLKLDESKGSLCLGKDADLICFDENINIKGVFTRSYKQGVLAECL